MTRDEVFASLHMAHSKAWANGPDSGEHHPFVGSAHRTLYGRFHAWRMAWWHELERAFPDKIKEGIHVDGIR